MGIFGIGGDGHAPTDDDAVTDDPTVPGEQAGPPGILVRRLLKVGIDGTGRFDSAADVAAAALAKNDSADDAVGAIVRSHLRLAAAGGFVTSLGGFVTMPVSLPANVLGFYVIATRMVAAVAVVRGYDVRRPEVRSAVLLTLVNADSEDLLKKAGMLSGGKVASIATQHLPAPVLMAVNKGVGFRLLRQVGEKSLTRFGKAVPLAGGFIGAGMDTYMLKQIADKARTELPAQQGAAR